MPSDAVHATQRPAVSLLSHASDPTAVVDERLRVFGVQRLRVVDASIMPTLSSGNTHAPAVAVPCARRSCSVDSLLLQVMVGEKGAHMIVEDHK